MVFLSFGAGVQSSVMLMLAIRGEIERPDHVIFADTGFEPRAVYAQVDWAERQCAKAGIPFHRVSAAMNMREEFEAFERGDKQHWDSRPPFFVTDNRRGGRGAMQRQCTRRAKIEPIQRAQLHLMGHKTARGAGDGEAVIQIGISTDEARRAAPSHDRWIERDYPLIDPLKMSRKDCQSWWEANYPHVNLPSSSCVICPYKSAAMWRAMKANAPHDWATATEYDDRMRAAYEARTEQSVFVSKTYEPLSSAEFGEAQGALDLEDDIYCAGGCGL